MIGRRIRRSLSTLRQIYREQGALRGTIFAVRVLRRKLLLLLLHVFSLARTRTLRHSLRQERAAGSRQPPLSAEGGLTIAVAVTGGVGDLIIGARLLRDLSEDVPGLAFDIYYSRPATASWIMAAVPGFRQAHHDILFDVLRREYGVSLGLNQTVVAYDDEADSAALRRHPRLIEALRTLRKARAEVEDFIQQHPYRDDFLARMAVFAGSSRRDYLHRMAGIRYRTDRFALPKEDAAPARFGLTPGGYVTVHNGFDPDFVITGSRATKCYPHFGAVVALLKQQFPDLRFVQVGTSTSEPIAECDLDLIGRTTLREATGILAGAALHLDNEGGLVHIAACFGVRSVVLFGPTPSSYFGYPDNINIEPAVCGDCWWLTRSWMERCAKGYPVPRCLHEIEPKAVALAAAPALAAALGSPATARAPARNSPAMSNIPAE